VTPAPAGVLGLVQVSLGLAKLAKPVLWSVRHGAPALSPPRPCLISS